MRDVVAELKQRAKSVGLGCDITLSGRVVIHSSEHGYGAMMSVKYRGTIYEVDLYLRNRYGV